MAEVGSAMRKSATFTHSRKKDMRESERAMKRMKAPQRPVRMGDVLPDRLTVAAAIDGKGDIARAVDKMRSR